MVDHGILDKSDYNNDYVSKLLEINEYLTKPAFVNLDNKKYLVDYQNGDGYNTYAIINDNKVYGLAYDDKSDAVSMVKDKKVYIMNQEKLLQRYNEDDYLEDELNISLINDNKYLTYIKYLAKGKSAGLAYLANGDKDILLKFLLSNKKRPLLISLTKIYLNLGIFSLYRNRNYELLNNYYLLRNTNQLYSFDEIDNMLNEMQFPSYIPDDIINTYLDKDNHIKTLKKVVKRYDEIIK